MTLPTGFLTFAECEREAFDLLSEVNVLYAGSKLQQIHDTTAQYLADMRGLLANRDIAAPTVGFIGDRNAGKSYLLRMLVRDEEVKNKIPCGMGDDERTDRLIWVGAELPPGLDPHAEVGLSLHDPVTQLAIEENVTLVDIPGFNDTHGPAAQRARELALRSCQVKVFVFAAAAATAERVETFARLAPGPIIVPVLNLTPHMPGSAEAVKLAASYERSVRAGIVSCSGVGDTVVREAVIVPDGAARDPILEDSALTFARFTRAIQDAVVEARKRPHLAQSTARMRRARFLEELRRVVEPEYLLISELLANIERDARELPRQLLPHLLGSERIAAAGIRIWLRAEVLHRTPAYFFPLRSFLGLLALTSRTWDSLVLALGGSVPSLFTSFASIARNVRLLRGNANTRSDEEMERTLRLIALDQQHADLVALRCKLDKMSNREAPTEALIPKPQLDGLAELRDAAMNSFETSVAQHALPGWLLHLTGCLSFAWCGIMLYGPLKGIYGHHLTTLWTAVQTGAPLAWTDFPVPPMSTVIGWFVLAFIPVFAAALLLQAFAASANRVHRCHKDMEKGVADEMDHLTARNILTLTLRDPKLDACRSLFGRLFKMERHFGKN